MSVLAWLTDAQLARLELYFTQPHDKPRIDGRRAGTTKTIQPPANRARFRSGVPFSQMTAVRR